MAEVEKVMISLKIPYVIIHFPNLDFWKIKITYDICNLDFQNQDLDFWDIPWRKDTRLAIEGSAVSKINAFE